MKAKSTIFEVFSSPGFQTFFFSFQSRIYVPTVEVLCFGEVTEERQEEQTLKKRFKIVQLSGLKNNGQITDRKD